MINIAICDDEKEIIHQLNNSISDYFEKKPQEYSVCSFTDANSFLKSNISLYDIVFLDIKINKHNGLEIAKEIKLKNCNSVIILISQYHEFLPSGYRVKAFRYILKPDLHNVFNEDMDSALLELNMSKGFFEYKVYSNTYRINYEDILYFESKYPKIHIKTVKSVPEASFGGNIDEIEPKLAGNIFIRVGKSYIINANHTKKINNMKAYMDNGDTISISRDYIEQARNNLLRIKRGKQWNI